jgi:hypothetical protein
MILPPSTVNVLLGILKKEIVKANKASVTIKIIQLANGE